MHRWIALAAFAAACAPASADPNTQRPFGPAPAPSGPPAGSPAGSPAGPPGASPAGPLGPDEAEDRERAALAVLDRHCRPCHGGPDSSGGFDVTDLAALRTDGLIAPGDSGGSPLAQRMATGEMPPELVAVRPSAAELAAVRAWIDQLSVAATVRSAADLERVLAADHAALPYDARPYARWLSLAHLASAGVPEPQLARYRAALTVLLASLSWSPQLRAPVAVDAQRTIFRIDLRDLGWTSSTWDAIRAAHPYGVARPAGVPDAIRADWLVATASRPPLYHTILGIPARDTELARRLGIDLAWNVSHGHVARAGFTSSGVSTSNRVIERHATRHGALWRSYDFRSSRGREDIFAHPLDFVPAGGEIIFNLPNGLQGYMLVDEAGRRIDKAPTAIVSDPRRPDRAVENGVSCIGCHAAGIIPRADQLRAAADELHPYVRDRVRELHPPAEDLTRLYAADRARFAAALAALGATGTAGGASGGAPDPAAEPVTLLVARYEAELDLRLAAAELGLLPDDFERRLARSPALRRSLAGLTVRGGRIKRETWEAGFAGALRELGVGLPAGGAYGTYKHGGGDPGLPVWIDRRRRTWVRLPGVRLDQVAAVAACRARGLELPRPDELVAAVADGLAGGLALDAALWTAGTRLDAANQRYAAVVDPFTGATRRADAADRHAVACVQI